MAPLSEEVIGTLQRFRNVILEGPPGTGKTFVVERLAAMWSMATGRPLLGDGSGAYALTFHPSTSYEDFVEGLRYEPRSGSFQLRNGFMTRAVVEAEANPGADFLLLLDEVNRANVPKVLGDLLLTLEPSKRTHWDGSAWVGGVSATLPYSGRLFSVPDNVYVLGTMNTSDRSIAPLSATLRRRFAFVRVRPLQAGALASELTASCGPSIASLAATSIERLDELNARVLRPVLGPDGELGHSYLFDLAPSTLADPKLRTVLQKAAASARKVFWTEVRAANGGSGNQFDLVETGAGGGKGSLELYYPLLTTGGTQPTPPSHPQTHEFTLVFDGRTFADNVLRWNSGNSNYRLYLQGETASGEKLSAVANTRDPVPDKAAARTFEHRVLIWLERSDGSLEVERVPNTAERRGALRSVSGWSHKSKGGSPREFGLIEMPKLSRALMSGDEPRMTWRYAILPQLVELAVANGVEDLFDPARRHAWQSAHGSPADATALLSFDAFLAGMSIWLRVVGHDLGRTLMILDRAPTATTSGATAAAVSSGSTSPPAPTTSAADSPPADIVDGSSSDPDSATDEVGTEETSGGADLVASVAFRAAPNRRRLGFVASADGERSAAVLVLPKTWRTGPPSTTRVSWPADGHLNISAYEGDVVVVEADGVECDVLRRWLVEVQYADAELLELLVGTPGSDRLVEASPQPLEPILDLLELFDRCSISLVEDELPHSAERHQLVRLVLYRRLISILEPLIARLRPQYRELEDALPTPRGRILDRSIVVTLASRLPTVDCRFDEHSHATDLAVVLLAAIRTVARQGGTPRTSSLFRPLQGRASRLARQLEGVPTVDRRIAYRMSRSLRIGRLEAEFAKALPLARRVLSDDVPTPGAGRDLSLETFRVGVPTEKLWEAALRQALACVPTALTYVNTDNKPAIAAVEVPAPWTACSAPKPSERFPDFLVLASSPASNCLWCVDAKYKDTPARLPAADDANQLFVYSHLAAVAGRRVDKCALVYPSATPRGLHGTLKRELDHTIPLLVIEALFPARGDLRTLRSWDDYLSRTSVGLAHVLVP